MRNPHLKKFIAGLMVLCMVVLGHSLTASASGTGPTDCLIGKPIVVGNQEAMIIPPSTITDTVPAYVEVRDGTLSLNETIEEGYSDQTMSKVAVLCFVPHKTDADRQKDADLADAKAQAKDWKSFCVLLGALFFILIVFLVGLFHIVLKGDRAKSSVQPGAPSS